MSDEIGGPPDFLIKIWKEAQYRWEKSVKPWFVIDEQDDLVAADFDTKEECENWIKEQVSPIYHIERNPRIPET